MSDIEDFLRENKPQVKEDPTFILEAQRRMEQVEGIKAEVDRQRSRGRVALIIALCAGLAAKYTKGMTEFILPAELSAIPADARGAPGHRPGCGSFQASFTDLMLFRLFFFLGKVIFVGNFQQV